MSSKPDHAERRWGGRLVLTLRVLAAWILVTAVAGCGGAVKDPGNDTGGTAGNGGAGNAAGGNAGAGGTDPQGGAAGSDVPPMECPLGLPRSGSTCVSDGQTCDYAPAWCATCRCLYHCWNGVWVEDGTGCGDAPPPPPPVESCPADRPKDGTYCAAAPRAGCTYVASYCRNQPNGWTTYDCVANIWRAGVSSVGSCNPQPEPSRIEPPWPEAGVDPIDVHLVADVVRETFGVVPPDASVD